MIELLSEIIPKSNCKNSNAKDIYIVDYKHIHNGIVDLHEQIPEVNFVHLSNINSVEVYFNGFLESALEIEVGNYSSQCECIIFSNPYSSNTWTLFIETKYVNSIENAFRESNDYPYSMVNQIIDTVKYFRDKNLMNSYLGNKFVKAYYVISPSISEWLKNKAVVSKIVKHGLNILVHSIQKFKSK